MTTTMMFLPTPPMGYPTSPDPTPLRMLAFSVAEAALQNDPNSPSLGIPSPDEVGRWNGEWIAAPWKAKGLQQNKQKGHLWEVVERAQARKASPPPDSPPLTSPISPSSTTYNFILPPNSPLAASISNAPPRSTLSLSARRLPLVTRSAEPSPTKSTFGTLDQSRPPPEFVPRLSAEEFSVKSRQVSSGKHTRTKSDSIHTPLLEKIPVVTGVTGVVAGVGKPKGRLPSLAQIQAKINNSGTTTTEVVIKRSSQPQPLPAMIRARTYRTNSDDSVDSEILTTPTEERPSLAILARRPSPPPGFVSTTKEDISRLPKFLRDRQSINQSQLIFPKRPVLKVTPPSLETRPAIPPIHFVSTSEIDSDFEGGSHGYDMITESQDSPIKVVSPREHRFNLSIISNPPTTTTTQKPSNGNTNSYSPGSPNSIHTASPTLSVPIITCTPAPSIIIDKDGVEVESDEEQDGSDDVVVFDGGSVSEESQEKEEREKRGQAMRDRLRLRRQSD